MKWQVNNIRDYRLASMITFSVLHNINTCTERVENFEGGKCRAIQDFALFRKFRGY